VDSHSKEQTAPVSSLGTHDVRMQRGARDAENSPQQVANLIGKLRILRPGAKIEIQASEGARTKRFPYGRGLRAGVRFCEASSATRTDTYMRGRVHKRRRTIRSGSVERGREIEEEVG
jgi:hypothetical protein